ncbi:transcription termination factor Rho [Amycolatopsis sp. CA-230715]|uniref:transcription termination factor Rho n=1 Tax=Amycolatopsis sp. CA-230715 TaxID=2745196 RepID=UPI001C02FE46|nr:Transcription termination factor Rho [Amycolatopsis sp. CA-230715]
MPETLVPEPIRGILDIGDKAGFVRGGGYLPSADDAHVPLAVIRKHGLRHGDLVLGAKRPAQQQKAGTLTDIVSVNGIEPEEARHRPEFEKLTPVHPHERLLLETTPTAIATRVIDLVMPVGKGQRALITSPPKAGKTSVLQAIANAIAVNHPRAQLMVVLVDERPEEVTDMARSVRGEVISSTFDRPPHEHLAVAELAVARARRRAELGQDVVLLFDSLTRLGRAYNLATKASGRILSGGIDAATLHPLKRFLGSARAFEEGGSLTIVATAMVENGSLGDTVLFEELKSTGNAELKLDRRTAERRVFPAIDIPQSSTRREELLLTPEELAITHELRRALATDPQHAIDHLLDQLRKTRSNAEFLMRFAGARVAAA